MKAIKPAFIWGLQGLVAGASIALLEFEFHFTFPQAAILVAVLSAWWAISTRLKAIQQDVSWLHTATNGLILPRLTRVERRQRGVRVPEPSEEDTDEYDDWAAICAVNPILELKARPR